MSKPRNLLILGDSYSQIGAWVTAMAKKLGDVNIVNLGVSSASLKDREADRIAYPYSDRPTMEDNSGNHNTIACQIEKLKRLMAGIDLDQGESPVYQSPADYPNVVIIEGGMNDLPDSDETAAAYSQQFVKFVKDVWIKEGYEETVKKGDTYIKRPLDEVDRTCFAGAYRYLVEELTTLFPQAQFFFTTASRMGYWFYDINAVRDKTAAQQRDCARLCGAAVIDWNACGGINTIANSPTGNGTEADPYPQVIIHGPDTDDAMHPNDRGAKKYGSLAANMIQLYYLDIDD